MKKQISKCDRRYRIIADKHCVTTIVYLSETETVITKVFNDGNVEVINSPP